MDFINEIKAVFDIKKLPTKFFILIAVITGTILFAPADFLQEINLSSFEDKYGDIVGLVFLFSAGLVVINFFIWLFNFINQKLKFKKWKKELAESIKTLDEKEKSVIREFAIQGQKSVEMPIDDPVVSGLLDKGILRINRQFGDSAIIQGRFAALSLTKDSEKIMTHEDLNLKKNPSDEEIYEIRQSRPKWIDRFHTRY